MAGSTTCPQCGKPAPITDAIVRFCGSCGASMAAAPAPAPAAAPAPAPGSRRQNPKATMMEFSPKPDSSPGGATQAAYLPQPTPQPFVPVAAPAPAPMPMSAVQQLAVQTPAIAVMQRAEALGRVDPSATIMTGPPTDMSVPPPAISYAPQPQPHAYAAPEAAQTSHVSHPAPNPNRTLLGMMSGPDAGSLAPAASAVSAPPMASNAPEGRRGFASTMLGVALPGIAPTGASAPPVQPHPSDSSTNAHYGAAAGPARASGPIGPIATPVPRGAAEAFRKRRARDANQAVIPAPAPLVDEPLPLPPRIVRGRGLPIPAVLGAVAVATLALGAAALTFSHGTPTITGEPRTGSDGAELLHLSCPKCEDGTTAMLEAKTATMAKGEADLALVSPLHPGKNTLDIDLHRPGIARDETVKLEVPVTFRLAPDLSRLPARPPSVGVRIDALPGSRAQFDGIDVPLDAAGHGAVGLDVAKDVEGTSDEMKRIERNVPYEITPPANAANATGAKGAASVEKGSLALRIGIAQLHLDSPGLSPVTDKPFVLVAGVVAPGAVVYVNDAPVPTAADGRFSQNVLLVLGATPITVAVTQGPTVATRMVHLTALRVPDLVAEAAARNAKGELGYDDVATDIDSHAGQDIAVDGAVVEARQVGHQMLMLIDDRRKCAAPPCLARVIYGGDGAPTTGKVSAYGKVTRSFRTVSGRIVPEISADFLLPDGKVATGRKVSL